MRVHVDVGSRQAVGEQVHIKTVHIGVAVEQRVCAFRGVLRAVCPGDSDLQVGEVLLVHVPVVVEVRPAE